MTTSPRPVTWFRLRTDGIAWHDVDGRIFVLDDTEQVYLTLNDTGATLWRRLATGATAEDLIVELRSEYGIDSQTAAADLQRFLQELADHGLIDVF